MTDLEKLIRDTRKEFGPCEEGTIGGDVLSLCDVAEFALTLLREHRDVHGTAQSHRLTEPGAGEVYVLDPAADDWRTRRDALLDATSPPSPRPEPEWLEFDRWPGGPDGPFVDGVPVSMADEFHNWAPNPLGHAKPGEVGYWEICTDNGCSWMRLGPFVRVLP